MDVNMNIGDRLERVPDVQYSDLYPSTAFNFKKATLVERKRRSQSQWETWKPTCAIIFKSILRLEFFHGPLTYARTLFFPLYV